MTITRKPVDPNVTITDVPLWHRGDRVIVLRGEHEGRTGTVSMLPSDPFARYTSLEIPNVMVSLDGEPGQVASGPGAVARGGRGGISIKIPCGDLASYDGPPGQAVGRHGGSL